MSTRSIAATLFALAAVAAGGASAQTIRPGLWEVQVTMPGRPAGMPSMAKHIEMMKQQMASMPPEQRQEIQKAIDQMSASGTEFTADGMRTKQCVTKEQIAKFMLPQQRTAEGCTQTMSRVGGNEAKVNMQCTQPPMTVDAVFKRENEKSYRFESTSKITGPGGQTITQKGSGTGKWLSDNCGNVKPASDAE